MKSKRNNRRCASESLGPTTLRTHVRRVTTFITNNLQNAQNSILRLEKAPWRESARNATGGKEADQ